ncbi:serine hydrolase domain-containing protein [Micromonospora sp. NPDC050795]|uniref:serine hydrolase domain-containing protein n=1 Tax=Micromonospora sp. NPDC050795 TaxID=3364282 RepID=UPI003796C79E
MRGDEVLQRGAWGVDGDGRSITTQTPFLLGSTSKSFTALAVAQLVEAGRIGLDTTASTYLPWLRLGDADTAGTVTVRQLLTHTSGLPQVWSTDLTDRYDSRPGALTRLGLGVHAMVTARPPTSPPTRARDRAVDVDQPAVPRGADTIPANHLW